MLIFKKRLPHLQKVQDSESGLVPAIHVFGKGFKKEGEAKTKITITVSRCNDLIEKLPEWIAQCKTNKSDVMTIYFPGEIWIPSDSDIE